jgi:hypothetical protein
MKPWQTVIRDGKASKVAICRNNQYIAQWSAPWVPGGFRYSLTIGDTRIGFFDTPEEAKAMADELREAA